MNNAANPGLAPLSQADYDLLLSYVSSQGLPEQLDAITCDLPLTVVSAGAGTGKTWTLAWRFVWTVLTREEAGRMLTLTFTEKAAAEMKIRIASLLRELEPALRESKELSLRRTAALKGLDQAYISTIHSFGHRVIGEAGLALDIEPSSRLISDAAEADEFWDEARGALDRLDAAWFTRGMDDDPSFGEMASALLSDEKISGVISRYGPKGIADFARKFEGMMGDFGYGADSILKDAESGDPGQQRLRAALLPEVRELANVWREVLSAESGDFGKGKLAECLKQLCAAWRGRDFMARDLCLEFVCDVYTRLIGQKDTKALQQLTGVTLKDWRKKVEKVKPLALLLMDGWSEDELDLRGALLRLAWLCWRKWDAYKMSRGGITFGDMISLAGHALKANPEYASRFSEILVDEFQDTNQRQDGLLNAIREANPKARLFIVGDLKQSIYRFRNADLTLFGGYIRRVRNGEGRYVTLSRSFRSGEAVLDAVNTRFSRLWRDRLGEGLDIPYEPLESPRGLSRAKPWIDERQRTRLPVFETVIEKPDSDDEPVDKVRLRVSRRLALRLSQLVESGAEVWDKKANALRPIRWGDIAVLVPTRTSYEPLRQAFSETGIPSSFNSSKSYYKRMEIRDLASLASFLADASDRTALAGVLCSPFSGLTQEEAQALLPRLASGADNRRGALDIVRDSHPELAARLEALCRVARVGGPSSAIASLLADSGRILPRIQPLKRAGVLANLRRAVSLLKDYESSVAYSPVGAAAYLQRSLQGAQRSGGDAEEPPAESGDNAVHVMTVHASKGLEFSLVVLCGMENKPRLGVKGVAPSRWLLASAPKEFPDRWQVDGECRLGQVHSFLEKGAELEERQRLYYVALTRARDGVILCGIEPKKKDLAEIESLPEGSFLRMESEAASALAPSEGEITAEQLSECLLRNTAGQVKNEASSVSVPLKADRPRSLRSVSATSWSIWNSCPAAWRMNVRQHLDLSWNAGAYELPDEETSGGALLGSVAHWVLSRWDFTDEGYKRILSLQDGCLPPEYRSLWRSSVARAELENFLVKFHTPAGEALTARMRLALRVGSLERESGFRVRLGSCDLVGAVDVFWVEKDESGRPVRLCVRDYKTTKMPNARKRREWVTDLYARQLKFYALALRMQHPEYESLELDLAFWNLRRGEEQKLAPMTSQEERQLREAILKHASCGAAGPWEPELTRCDGCAYAGGCFFKRREQQELEEE